MTPAHQIEVRLTEEQRAALACLVHTGTPSAHATRRARILLKADAAGSPAWPDERIAEAFDVHRMTVSRVRAPFAREGLDAVLHKKKAQDRQYRKLDGQQEARLVALTCSAPPDSPAAMNH